MSTIWIVRNQFQSHEYFSDCVKITNQSHEYYLECAFFTNQRRVYYLEQLFYSALKSICMSNVLSFSPAGISSKDFGGLAAHPAGRLGCLISKLAPCGRPVAFLLALTRTPPSGLPGMFLTSLMTSFRPVAWFRATAVLTSLRAVTEEGKRIFAEASAGRWNNGRVLGLNTF